MKTMKMLLAALACALLISCSKDAPDSPLAYVPADTPYVFAALEPLPPDLRAQMYRQASTVIESNMPIYRDMAENLADEHPRFGRVMNVLLDEFEGKTIEQVFAANGVNPAGQWLIYGLGFSPVERIQLADPAAFEALLTRLEKAWGEPVPRVTVEDVKVRKLALDDSGLALYAAIRGDEAIFAFLPVNQNQAMLRTALGLDLPENSLADSDALAKLADARGYSMHGLGYLDVTRLPGLLLQGGDPLLGQLVSNDEVDMTLFESQCRADLQRIAARMPMFSFGYSGIDQNQYSVRTHVRLAPDIVAAFSGLEVPLPGLGANSDAMFDMAAAWPIAAMEQFLGKQVDAIQAQPFTCPKLAKLNQMADDLGPRVGMLGIVPWTNLRGMRIRLDRLDLKGLIAGDSESLQNQAAILLASTQPAGLTAMAQTSLSDLFAAPLEPDGDPVALKSSYLDEAGVEASVAMTDQAVAVAVGEDKAKLLDEVLHAPIGQAGLLMRVHVSGSLYRNLFGTLLDVMKKQQSEAEADDDESADVITDSNLAQIRAVRKQMENLEYAEFTMRMKDSGLVLEQTTVLRDTE